MPVLLLLILAILFLAWNRRAADGTEQQPYELIKQYDEFEIRLYPPAIYASVKKDGVMMETGSAGFRDLASYIFGGNSESQKIAMTAPVVFRQDDLHSAGTEVSFVMPAGMSLQNMPQPDRKNIRLWNTDSCYMAVTRFGGFASNREIEAKVQQLREALQREGIAFENEVFFMAYNPPYQLSGRRNEVALRLKAPL